MGGTAVHSLSSIYCYSYPWHDLFLTGHGWATAATAVVLCVHTRWHASVVRTAVYTTAVLHCIIQQQCMKYLEVLLLLLYTTWFVCVLSSHLWRYEVGDLLAVHAQVHVFTAAAAVQAGVQQAES